MVVDHATVAATCCAVRRAPKQHNPKVVIGLVAGLLPQPPRTQDDARIGALAAGEWPAVRRQRSEAVMYLMAALPSLSGGRHLGPFPCTSLVCTASALSPERELL